MVIQREKVKVKVMLLRKVIKTLLKFLRRRKIREGTEMLFYVMLKS